MSLENIMSEKPASPKIPSQNSILLRDYAEKIAETDKLPEENLKPVLLGLFGEVGSIMATSKKYHREEKAYSRHADAMEEELGDTLWYFVTLCRRLGYGIDKIFSDVTNDENYKETVVASDLIDGPISRVFIPQDHLSLDENLLRLGQAVSKLPMVEQSGEESLSFLLEFADRYLRTVKAAQIPFAKIVNANIEKVRGRFRPPDYENLPVFDDGFPEEEKLPREFEIEIRQDQNGKSYMKWGNVKIGDPLTDNIPNEDGYRFHDVFHLSYAAILHWSPIIRRILKLKRKSNPRIDEAEDGARATFLEEGLSAWIFSYAKDLNFFENRKQLSFDLLKNVQRFVKGYEVERCPLYMWERAILDGYAVFRDILKNNGGVVVCNLNERTITYKPLPKPE